MSDKHYRMSKTTKAIISGISDKETRRKFKKAYIEAEFNSAKKERFMMLYDVPEPKTGKKNRNG